MDLHGRLPPPAARQCQTIAHGMGRCAVFRARTETLQPLCRRAAESSPPVPPHRSGTHYVLARSEVGAGVWAARESRRPSGRPSGPSGVGEGGEVSPGVSRCNRPATLRV
jgi:hypothetical protein